MGWLTAITPRQTGRWLSGVVLCLWPLDYNLPFYLENAWVSDGEAPPCYVHVPGKVPKITNEKQNHDFFGLLEGVQGSVLASASLPPSLSLPGTDTGALSFSSWLYLLKPVLFFEPGGGGAHL